MTKINRIFTLFIFFLLLHAAVLFHTKVYAATLTLSPSSATVTNGETTEINIRINSDGTPLFGADAILTFPGTDFEITAIANGGYFSDLTSASDVSGRIEIHGYLSSLYDSRTGSGTLATLKAKAKKGTGNASLSFICTGGNSNTQILNTSGNNILACNTLNQSTLTFTEVALTPTPTSTPKPTPTSTPTPTPTPTPTGTQTTTGTPTNTPTPTPQGGNAIPNCTGMSVSPNYGGKPLTITVMCFGTDSDGYLNESEFVFGDGQKQNVVKNVGSPGYHSTTHTYGAIGSYKASCRVRDNNTVYSHESKSCESIVTVTSESISVARTTPTKKPTPTITKSPDPTPTFIELAQYQEPTLTPSDTLTPTEPTKAKVSYTFPLPLLFILPGVLLLIAGVYLKMKE